MKRRGVPSLLTGALLLASAACDASPGRDSARADGLTHGPWPGPVSARSATIWFRTARAETTDVSVRRAERDGGPETDAVRIADFASTTSADEDFIARVALGPLVPNTEYLVRCLVRGRPEFAEASFRTPPENRSTTRLVFGSCARETRGEDNPVWPAIAARSPDALVFIGDTPYIDSAELKIQRRRYAEFFSDEGLAALRARVPLYAVWDDHDFGSDGADGRMPMKREARRAFVEWHSNDGYGTGDEGVFTRFRSGPCDVFLLDTRYWARTEKSATDATRPTLLGAAQWAWLKKELAASTAPFKLLVSGMVWNDAVRAGKTDAWTAYPHERAALLGFLAESKTSGVILIGGDVHRSRAFETPPETTGLAYPLYEFVTSPLGPNVHKNADVPSRTLLFDRGRAHSFLEIDAEESAGEATLVARWIDRSGDVFFTKKTRAADLR